MIYTLSRNCIHSIFFENVVDRMVEEVYHRDLFKFQNVSLLEQVAKMEDISKLEAYDRDEQIEKTYQEIINEKSSIFSQLAAVTGITSSFEGGGQ